MRADRWIGYTGAIKALARLEMLLAWPPKQRMPNLLIVGPTNNGKIDAGGEVPPAAPAEPGRHRSAGIKFASASRDGDARARRAIADPVQHDLACGRGRPDPAWRTSKPAWWLSGNGTEMLIIDEPHNILAGNAPRRREFLNLLRFLGNQLRFCVVGVGTHEAYPAVRSDDQLENRFEPLVLPHWVPTSRPARCWPASRRHSRCAGPRRSAHRRWPTTSSAVAKAPSVSSPTC